MAPEYNGPEISGDFLKFPRDSWIHLFLLITILNTSALSASHLYGISFNFYSTGTIACVLVVPVIHKKNKKMTTTVCITGGSGFLGAMTVKVCLERGWIVRTTTRNPIKHEERLKSLVPSASSNLTIFQADLLQPESFNEAFQGCDVIFHTASPFFLAGANEQNVVEPAVQGTRNVFDAAKVANVKKIVLTSSTAAIYGWYGKHEDGHVMTEADWSDEDALIQAGNWYSVSKQRAEQLAWQRAEEDGVKVCFFFLYFCYLLVLFDHLLRVDLRFYSYFVHFPPFFLFLFLPARDDEPMFNIW